MTSEKCVQKFSLRSRHLEVVGEREDRRAQGRHAKGEGMPARKVPENRFNSHSVSAEISNWSRGSQGKKLPRRARKLSINSTLTTYWRSYITPPETIKLYTSKFRSWRSLQSGLIIMGLCGCNLKEQLEWSNSIHDGKNWQQIRISRSGERQKICWIIAMKIRGHILCSGELGGLCCQWNAYHQNLDETLTRGMNFEKTFHYCIICHLKG